MKTVIAGSRTLTSLKVLSDILKKYRSPITEVVCGTARGIDSLGRVWAEKHKIPVKLFPPDWSRHGKAAGFLRNKEMADYTDCAVIIWDGKSKGTKNMINQMIKVDKPFYLVNLNDSTNTE